MDVVVGVGVGWKHPKQIHTRDTTSSTQIHPISDRLRVIWGYVLIGGADVFCPRFCAQCFPLYGMLTFLSSRGVRPSIKDGGDLSALERAMELGAITDEELFILLAEGQWEHNVPPQCVRLFSFLSFTSIGRPFVVKINKFWYFLWFITFNRIWFVYLENSIFLFVILSDAYYYFLFNFW